jgi:hypothetical protein
MRKKKELQEIKPQPQLRRYNVSLKFSPERTIIATTQDEAWEMYKQQMGIISTGWIPEIREVVDAS